MNDADAGASGGLARSGGGAEMDKTDAGAAGHVQETERDDSVDQVTMFGGGIDECDDADVCDMRWRRAESEAEEGSEGRSTGRPPY